MTSEDDVIFQNLPKSKPNLGSMNNIPNMPHVKFQSIRTYSYDVIDVCL